MLKEVQDTVFMATDGTKFIDKGEAYNCKLTHNFNVSFRKKFVK